MPSLSRGQAVSALKAKLGLKTPYQFPDVIPVQGTSSFSTKAKAGILVDRFQYSRCQMFCYLRLRIKTIVNKIKNFWSTAVLDIYLRKKPNLRFWLVNAAAARFYVI
jgi:hypothetical protein